ncbi:hypothetical protein AVEN_200683-1 [Araneus ventricosus]|uniref:DNA helicase Pif1-like 2B domain-containing protein n=1 Tax=Araneus ventricosus TaxID=182803 RepID=A0A4Y2JB47_ARAVE|nr:hypothetical protein AVEN_200683-1 [Araneus ventricosus]
MASIDATSVVVDLLVKSRLRDLRAPGPKPESTEDTLSSQTNFGKSPPLSPLRSRHHTTTFSGKTAQVPSLRFLWGRKISPRETIQNHVSAPVGRPARNIASSSTPSDNLRLKFGVPELFIRNLDVPRLCNGQRFQITHLGPKVVLATDITGIARDESAKFYAFR